MTDDQLDVRERFASGRDKDLTEVGKLARDVCALVAEVRALREDRDGGDEVIASWQHIAQDATDRVTALEAEAERLEAENETLTERNSDLEFRAAQLRADRDWLLAEIEKPADVLNNHDAMTEEDGGLWEASPGDALAKAVTDLLADLREATKPRT